MNTRKGFTLVELLVVIAILAILATVSVVGYTSFINRANVSNAQTEAHQVQTTIESFIISGYPYELGKKDDVTYYVVDLEGDWDGKADTDETKELRVCKLGTDGEYVVVASLTDAEVKAMNADFAGLPGTFTVTAGVLTYVGKNLTATDAIEIK